MREILRQANISKGDIEGRRGRRGKRISKRQYTEQRPLRVDGAADAVDDIVVQIPEYENQIRNGLTRERRKRTANKQEKKKKMNSSQEQSKITSYFAFAYRILWSFMRTSNSSMKVFFIPSACPGDSVMERYEPAPLAYRIEAQPGDQQAAILLFAHHLQPQRVNRQRLAGDIGAQLDGGYLRANIRSYPSQNASPSCRKHLIPAGRPPRGGRRPSRGESYRPAPDTLGGDPMASTVLRALTYGKRRRVQTGMAGAAGRARASGSVEIPRHFPEQFSDLVQELVADFVPDHLQSGRHRRASSPRISYSALLLFPARSRSPSVPPLNELSSHVNRCILSVSPFPLSRTPAWAEFIPAQRIRRPLLSAPTLLWARLHP